MKIHLLSDLHLEVCDYKEEPPKDCDYIVLAGDIWLNDHAKRWITYKYPNNKVIYIAGNHEYYRSEYNEQLKILREPFNNPNYRFLENDWFYDEDHDTYFYGCTLWTNYKIMGESEKQIQKAKIACQASINDFIWITYTKSFFSPTNTESIHNDSVSSMVRALSIMRLQRPKSKVVIITHMGASKKAINPKYKGDIINTYFTSNLEYIMKDHNIDLWLSGHTHDSYDYMVGKTRSVCNPRGYTSPHGEPQNKAFNSQLVIEV